jgi:heparan-alpha-glucosaminide N-acetyltransferase
MTTLALEQPQSAKAEQSTSTHLRLSSIDAYRGFVMFLMMAEVWKLHRVAQALPDNSFWRFLAYHQSHVPWIGCSLHDLIQPSFSFLVGAALPFSIANRIAKGQSTGKLALHAFWRSIVLILLGVFLRSTGSSQTNWTFEDTLSQIGLGYLALFFLGLRCMRDQWIALGVVLFGYWLAFALFPAPGPQFDYVAVGVPKDSPGILTGFAAHWNKNSNLAWAFDTWYLNLFPRPKPFLFNGGGYATLSFIPTLGTMILGLIAGSVLRSARTSTEKVKWLAIAGAVSLVVGAAIGWLGLCPVVKRIWTPSWTIFSGGWCFLLTAAFYLVADVMGRSRFFFFLIVIGMNSIAAYCMAHLFDGFILKSFTTHLGADIFKIFGNAYQTLLLGSAVLLTLWLILYWMYRRKIFLKI